MEIILKILTLLILSGVFYNIRQHKRNDEWSKMK